MSLVEHKYIQLVSCRLEKFHSNAKNSYQFRCVLCGDSRKSKSKMRGYLYLNKDKWVYKCQNCGVFLTFQTFLKEFDNSLYRELLTEILKEKRDTSWNIRKTKDLYQLKSVATNKRQFFDDLDKISDLPTEHEAHAFLLKRKIPGHFYKDLYFTTDFKKFVVDSCGDIYDTLKENDRRIIIPFKNENGNIIGFQGRSLIQKASLRYITIKLDANYPKIFGLDRVEFKKPFYVCEGPFDSMFLKNSIAVGGSDFFSKNLNKDNEILVIDNEKRKEQTVKKIEKAITLGYKIVIWPNWLKEKDINDMVLAGHDPQKIVEENVFCGIEAMVRFSSWKKI